MPGEHVSHWEPWIRRRVGEDDLGRFVEYEGGGIVPMRLRVGDQADFHLVVTDTNREMAELGEALTALLLHPRDEPGRADAGRT